MSSSTPQRATLSLPVGHPDCRRRRRRHHHFLRGRQPCCHYIHFLIDRCRHPCWMDCCSPGSAGSITRQYFYRATLGWLTCPLYSSRRVACRCRHATRRFSLCFHSCLPALPTLGGYPPVLSKPGVRHSRKAGCPHIVTGGCPPSSSKPGVHQLHHQWVSTSIAKAGCPLSLPPAGYRPMS